MYLQPVLPVLSSALCIRTHSVTTSRAKCLLSPLYTFVHAGSGPGFSLSSALTGPLWYKRTRKKVEQTSFWKWMDYFCDLMWFQWFSHMSWDNELILPILPPPFLTGPSNICSLRLPALLGCPHNLFQKPGEGMVNRLVFWRWGNGYSFSWAQAEKLVCKKT